MPPRRRPTAAINLAALPPAFHELIRALHRPDAVAALAAPTDDAAATTVEPPAGLLQAPDRVPGDVAYQLTPMEMFRLTAPPFQTPDDMGEDRLWNAEVETQRVGKDGIEFDGDHWNDAAMLAFTTGDAKGPRPTFILSFDAAARARGVLREVDVYQLLRSGERQFLCTARRREDAYVGLTASAFEEARGAVLDGLLAKRALMQEQYIRVVAGVDAVTEMLAQQDARAAKKAPKRAARVAAPIGAEEQERARRGVDIAEIYERAAEHATSVNYGPSSSKPKSARRGHPIVPASVAADASCSASETRHPVLDEQVDVAPAETPPASAADVGGDLPLPVGRRRRGRPRGV